MERISSRYTLPMKWLVPLAWFAALGYFVAQALVNDGLEDAALSVGVPAVMAALGLLVMRTCLWSAADEVYDAGDHLVVRKGGEEDTVRLADVVSVSDDSKARLPAITLHLRQPGKFGEKVRFFPAGSAVMSGVTAGPHAVAEALMVRTGKPDRTAATTAEPAATPGQLDKISSPYTFAMKRAFPVIVFGALGIGAFRFLADGRILDELGMLIGFGMVAALAYRHMLARFWPAVDAVFDAGTHLVVRNGGKKVQVPYGDVQNVSFSTGPDRITLRLAKRCELGDEIVFFPRANKLGAGALGGNRVSEKLMARVARARANRA